MWAQGLEVVEEKGLGCGAWISDLGSLVTAAPWRGSGSEGRGRVVRVFVVRRVGWGRCGVSMCSGALDQRGNDADGPVWRSVGRHVLHSDWLLGSLVCAFLLILF
jgi:hypothetical protein